MSKQQIIKLLAQETRYKMFMLILKEERCCICEFQRQLGLNQANVSKHMKGFRELDMVNIEHEGKYAYYSLKESFINKHKKLIDYLRGE